MGSWTDHMEDWTRYEVVRTYPGERRASDLIAIFMSEAMAFDYCDYLNTIGIPAWVRPDFIEGRKDDDGGEA